jgi:hypothetical protein
MKKEDIRKEYDLFKIPVEKIPHYENPNQFASDFKRCSMYEYVSITYSGSTTANEMPSQLKRN